MSGATPSRSQPQNVPVRPSPTATSSQISRQPAASQSARARASQPSGATRMPAAAWISGSTITAKTSSPCSASSSARPSADGIVDRARSVQRRPEQRREGGVEGVDAAGGDGAERVAVVAVAQTDDARAARLAAQLRVAQRELDRHLAGARAALREEGAREAGGRRLQQRIGEGDRGGVREAEERRVRDAVELLAHGGVDLRPAVAVDVDPERRVAVEVAPATPRRSATSPRRAAITSGSSRAQSACWVNGCQSRRRSSSATDERTLVTRPILAASPVD